MLSQVPVPVSSVGSARSPFREQYAPTTSAQGQVPKAVTSSRWRAVGSKTMSPSTNRIHLAFPSNAANIPRTASFRAFSTKVPGTIIQPTLVRPCFSEWLRISVQHWTVCWVMLPKVVMTQRPDGIWICCSSAILPQQSDEWPEVFGVNQDATKQGPTSEGETPDRGEVAALMDEEPEQAEQQGGESEPPP